MLRASSIAALRERGESILNTGDGFNGDTTTLLRILAALLTAKIFEELPAVMDRWSKARNALTKVPRNSARHVACVIRTLMDVNFESGGGGLEAPSVTVERLRAIVTLREYAQSETDPQVVREMWLLEDALIAAGKYEEAQEVRRDAYHRLEEYVHDIPVGSV